VKSSGHDESSYGPSLVGAAHFTATDLLQKASMAAAVFNQFDQTKYLDESLDMAAIIRRYNKNY